MSFIIVTHCTVVSKMHTDMTILFVLAQLSHRLSDKVISFCDPSSSVVRLSVRPLTTDLNDNSS